MLRGEEFEKDIYPRLTLLDENLPFFYTIGSDSGKDF